MIINLLLAVILISINPTSSQMGCTCSQCSNTMSTFCNDQTCRSLVGQQNSMCLQQWNSQCAQSAVQICSQQGCTQTQCSMGGSGGGSGSCCQCTNIQQGGYCQNPICAQQICQMYQSCQCTSMWTTQCSQYATQMCNQQGGGGGGYPNGYSSSQGRNDGYSSSEDGNGKQNSICCQCTSFQSTYCNDQQCRNMVGNQNQACSQQWNSQCAQAAAQICQQSNQNINYNGDGNYNGDPNNPNGYQALGDNGGYDDFNGENENEPDVPMIVGTVIGVLAAMLIAGGIAMYYFWRKRKKNNGSERVSTTEQDSDNEIIEEDPNEKSLEEGTALKVQH